MKYSHYLESVIAETKQTKGFINVNLLFAGLVLSVSGVKGSAEDESERQRLQAAAEKTFGNLDVLSQKATALRESAGKSFTDSVMYQKLFYDAEQSAQKEQLSVLTADVVFRAILRNPTAQLMELSGKQPPKVKQTPAAPSALPAEKLVPDEKPAQTQPPTPENGYEQLLGVTENIKKLQQGLMSAVFGQNRAINILTTGYFNAMLKALLYEKSNRPAATFLFAGPPGVGKTFLAEKTAELLNIPFKRFDMSEYAEPESASALCGYDRNFKNPKPGQLTDFVKKNPQCLLLFDEIEKAHISVIHLFLQILDAGRLTDNLSESTVSFSSAVIIMTTNAGKNLYDTDDTGDFSGTPRKIILNALRKDTNPRTGQPLFPEAICSRFSSGNVVMFNRMESQYLIDIARSEIERNAKRIGAGTNLSITVNPMVYSALLFAEGGGADARTIRGRAETFLNNELFELLRLITNDSAGVDLKKLRAINIGLDLDNASPEVKKLFIAEQCPNILVYSEEHRCADTESHHFLYASQVDEAAELLRRNNVGFVLIDLETGKRQNTGYMNIEDVASSARDFLYFLRENAMAVPVYVLVSPARNLSDEEKYSFTLNGVRGFIDTESQQFDSEIEVIIDNLYRQSRVNELARYNHVLSFETAQTFDNATGVAQVALFDFRVKQAVDSEDSGTIMNNISKPKVRFDDIIGADEVKQELRFFVDFLQHSKKYLGTGLRAPRGVLLYGPPGTGKTMLAKAMAAETGAAFIAMEGNRFLKKYVGEGPEKVHEVFRVARKYAPSILFIDEIETIAKERGSEYGSAGVDEVLTALLTELDGFNTDVAKPVLVMAATNYGVDNSTNKRLDEAILRRFDRRVYIDLPNRENRMKYIKLQNEKNQAMNLSESEIVNIAMRSAGMSLAELENIVNFALRNAIRTGGTEVSDELFEDAFETYNNGEQKLWSSEQLLRTARHEAGHTLLYRLSGEKPSYVTIVSRGDFGGYMQHADNEDKLLQTKNDLLALIRTSLGGRASEIVYYGDEDGVSTGASGDLLNATRIAGRMLTFYGMDEEFGLVADGKLDTPEVRTAVKRILSDQMDEAIRLIRENRDKTDRLTEALLQKNYLTADEIEAILSV